MTLQAALRGRRTRRRRDDNAARAAAAVRSRRQFQRNHILAQYSFPTQDARRKRDREELTARLELDAARFGCADRHRSVSTLGSVSCRTNWPQSRVWPILSSRKYL